MAYKRQVDNRIHRFLFVVGPREITPGDDTHAQGVEIARRYRMDAAVQKIIPRYGHSRDAERPLQARAAHQSVRGNGGGHNAG